MFLEERQQHGDFVTKIADMVWRRNGSTIDTLEPTEGLENAADVARTEDVSFASGSAAFLSTLAMNKR